MRVLVCGGREFNSQTIVYDTIDRLHRHFGIECIIHGQDDFDEHSRNWAIDHVVGHQAFYPQVRETRRQRITRILVEGKPDLVVAFPGAPKGLLTRARVKKIDVITVAVSIKVKAPKKFRQVFA